MPGNGTLTAPGRCAGSDALAGSTSTTWAPSSRSWRASSVSHRFTTTAPRPFGRSGPDRFFPFATSWGNHVSPERPPAFAVDVTVRHELPVFHQVSLVGEI